jgi:aspartate-semialdehyde dehydrogenase
MSDSEISVAVVGATGAVGAEIISCLERSRLPIRPPRLLASPRSAGRTLTFRGEPRVVEPLEYGSFGGIDIAFFSAGSTVSQRYAPVAAEAGALVVDNSSAFRMDPTVPLVVPEVNAWTLAQHWGLIANPNCVAIIASVVLAPLHRTFGLRRVIASTYQAASGAGAAAMEELKESTRAALAGEPYTCKVLPHPYAFNVFSHNTPVDPTTGANQEENKVAGELRKILNIADLLVGVTCIRVPVLRAHAISLNLTFEDGISVDAARELLAAAAGVRVVDDGANNHFPMPIEATGSAEVLFGRIRRDASDPSDHSLALFVAGDQLLKGAALNAVQIAERLFASDGRIGARSGPLPACS